jgi:hypothetical protein
MLAASFSQFVELRARRYLNHPISRRDLPIERCAQLAVALKCGRGMHASVCVAKGADVWIARE